MSSCSRGGSAISLVDCVTRRPAFSNTALSSFDPIVKIMTKSFKTLGCVEAQWLALLTAEGLVKTQLGLLCVEFVCSARANSPVSKNMLHRLETGVSKFPLSVHSVPRLHTTVAVIVTDPAGSEDAPHFWDGS